MAGNTTQTEGSKISALEEKATPTGAELIVVADGGSNRKVKLSAVTAGEKSAREAADSQLAGLINTEISDRKAAVSSEKSLRENADNNLANLIQDVDEKYELATGAVVNVNQLCEHTAGYASPQEANAALTAKGVELATGALIRYYDGETWRWYRYKETAMGASEAAQALGGVGGDVAVEPQPITWELLFKESELTDFRGKQAALQSSADILVGAQTPQLTLTEEARRAVFDDLWVAAGCTIGTGASKYLCNGVAHTYEEAKYLYHFGNAKPATINDFYRNATIKTHLPMHLSSTARGENVFCDCKSLTKVDSYLLRPGVGCFARCDALTYIRVWAPVDELGNVNSAYVGCSALTTLVVSNVFPRDFDLADSPLLSLASLQNIVNKYNGSKAITGYVHPTVYAKLTDTANTQWYAVMTSAVAKKIAFATKS